MTDGPIVFEFPAEATTALRTALRPGSEGLLTVDGVQYVVTVVDAEAPNDEHGLRFTMKMSAS